MPSSELAVASAALASRAPAFRGIVAAAGPADLRWHGRRRTHFAELARSICHQQLAGTAARAIHRRFEGLYAGAPSPAAVLATPDAALRAVGLSRAKIASIRDLAAQVESGSVSLAQIGRKSDQEVVAELVRVRGIGRWTAEMFLIFQLRRIDVWPVDDFGVRKGYARLHAHTELPTPRELDALGEPLRPYRSLAAWYCWRAADPSSVV